MWKEERKKGYLSRQEQRSHLIQHPLNPRAASHVHPTLRKRVNAVLCADLFSRAVAGTKAEWVGHDEFARVEAILGF